MPLFRAFTFFITVLVKQPQAYAHEYLPSASSEW